MPVIKRFEDLRCWQNTRALANLAYDITEEIPPKNYTLINQFEGAALSVMNNISEGFGRYSKKDFIKFLNYSSASASEVKNMTCLIEDRKYSNQATVLKTRDLAEFCKNQILALISHLKKNLDSQTVSEPTKTYGPKHTNTLTHKYFNT